MLVGIWSFTIDYGAIEPAIPNISIHMIIRDNLWLNILSQVCSQLKNMKKQWPQNYIQLLIAQIQHRTNFLFAFFDYWSVSVREYSLRKKKNRYTVIVIGICSSGSGRKFLPKNFWNRYLLIFPYRDSPSVYMPKIGSLGAVSVA